MLRSFSSRESTMDSLSSDHFIFLSDQMTLKTSREKLLEAIEQCHLTKLISLVKHGHNIHMQNTLGQNFLVHILQQQPYQTPLLSKKRFQIFQFLIMNYNLNIHAFDHLRKNVFNWAVNLNCTQEALYLLNTSPGDVDILARDQTGSCSLHYAVEHGNDILVHGIVNYLVRYRMRFDIKDAHDNTPEDLARKLGYEEISQFLGEACRSTNFLSREIPSPQQTRPMTAKSPSLASMSSSAFFDSSEYFNLIETRVSLAKSFDDWKTVSALRSFKKKLNEKTHPSRIPDPTPQTKSSASFTSPFPSSSLVQKLTPSERMLPILELQMTSSYRRPFTPVYQQSMQPIVPFQRPFNVQRKMSQSSSRHISSAASQRNRDSSASQISISMLSDLQNRTVMPPVYKQHRSSVVTTN